MRALEFDNQAALARKANESLTIVKDQSHGRDEPETVEGTAEQSASPLDRKPLSSYCSVYYFTHHSS